MRFNPRTRELTLHLDDLYQAAASLAGVDGENPEYTRGIVDLVCAALDVPTEGGREIVEDQIRIIQHQQQARRREVGLH